MEKLELFRKGIKKLNKQVSKSITDHINERYPIYDGPLCTDLYYQSKFKVMWLMKEPYDEENGKGGEWSFEECCKDFDWLKQLVLGKARGTWQPVTYISYGIQNGFQEYDDMDYIRENHSMISSLLEIAWVNIQKLPSINLTTTWMGHIHQAFESHKDILLAQIDLLNPNVIICANTLNVVKEHLNLEKWPNPFIESAYEYSGRLIINVYHPSQRSINRASYVNNVIKCVEYWNKHRYHTV